MNGYLLDTDWAVDCLDGVRGVAEALGDLPEGSISLSVISLAELYEGVLYSRDPEEAMARLNHLLQDVALLGVTGETARICGQHRGRLRRQGRLIDSLDILIAATCIEHGLRLLTNNVVHFERIDGLQIGLEEE